VRTLRGLMLVGVVLALLAVVVFAGPARAAKPGNAAVRVCKQIDNAGFRNLGQCVNIANEGSGPPSSAKLDIGVGTYDCTGGQGGTCWGSLTGSGLNPNSTWFVFSGSFVQRAGQTDSSGNISATQLGFLCVGDQDAIVAAQAESPTGRVLTAAGAPC